MNNMQLYIYFIYCILHVLFFYLYFLLVIYIWLLFLLSTFLGALLKNVQLFE